MVLTYFHTVKSYSFRFFVFLQSCDVAELFLLGNDTICEFLYSFKGNLLRKNAAVSMFFLFSSLFKLITQHIYCLLSNLTIKVLYFLALFLHYYSKSSYSIHLLSFTYPNMLRNRARGL